MSLVDKREYVPYKSKYSLTIKNDRLKAKNPRHSLGSKRTFAEGSIDTMRNSSYAKNPLELEILKFAGPVPIETGSFEVI